MHRSLLVVAILAGAGVLIRTTTARHHQHAEPQQQHHHHHHPHHQQVIVEVPNTFDDNFNNLDTDNNMVVDSATGIVYNPYSKHHPGRHVCANQKNVTQPVKTRQTFCKPTYKKYTQRCNDNQLCSGIRVVYETGYREIVATTQSKQLHYYCCPGWKQINNRSHGCNKPVCISECRNGGTCTKPDFCTCQRGFTGRTCEHDVDECKEEKPCDQICVNLNSPGRYKCECRENYSLLDDGHSCKRDDDEIGFEAKEMQFEDLDERIHKIETILEQNNPTAIQHNLKDFDNKIELLSNDIGSLKKNIVNMAEYKEDLGTIKTKLFQLDKKSNKIDELSARYDKIKKCAFFNKICI